MLHDAFNAVLRVIRLHLGTLFPKQRTVQRLVLYVNAVLLESLLSESPRQDKKVRGHMVYR